VLVTGDRSFANVSAYVQSEVKVTANVTPIISAITETLKPKPAVPSKLISSATGINYRKLRDLLKAGNWRVANTETIRLTFSAVSGISIPRSSSPLNVWAQFPCEDLRIINQLWSHYSNGKFGFNVQRKIYESLGSTEKYNQAVMKEFHIRIGRTIKGGFGEPRDLIDENITPATPVGHLPGFQGGWGIKHIILRLECNL
jgi:hypothetical protein